MAISSDLLQLEVDLHKCLRKVFRKDNYIIQPLDYAYKPYRKFVEKYFNGPGHTDNATNKILFLGMNPGPKSSLQTGIPFGDVDTVRDWFGITQDIDFERVQKFNEKIAAKIQGMTAPSSDDSESGKRFWTVIRNKCPTPEDFFKQAWVYNYCPLAIFDPSNLNNITPPEFEDDRKNHLELLCSETLYKIIQLLKVTKIIALGRYAEEKANSVCSQKNLNISVMYLRHPSARESEFYQNRDWMEYAEIELGPILQNAE